MTLYKGFHHGSAFGTGILIVSSLFGLDPLFNATLTKHVTTRKNYSFMAEVTGILAGRSGHEFKADVTGETEDTLVVGIILNFPEKGGPVGIGDRVGVARFGVGKVVLDKVVVGRVGVGRVGIGEDGVGQVGADRVGGGLHVGQAMF